MSCPGTGQPIGLLLSLTYNCGVVDHTGETVLSNKKAGGPSWSKKQWRELEALIAAEKAAKARAAKAAAPLRVALRKAASAATELRGLLTDPFGPDHFPSEPIELLTGALDFAVAATETGRALTWANRAIQIAELLTARAAQGVEAEPLDEDVDELMEILMRLDGMGMSAGPRRGSYRFGDLSKMSARPPRRAYRFGDLTRRWRTKKDDSN